MSFQIVNQNNVPVSLEELNNDSIALFGSEEDSDSYQKTGFPGSWYQVIGGAIDRPGNYTSGWDNVKVDIFSVFTKRLALMDYNLQIQRLKEVNEIVAPYFTLINKWCDKGYKPVKIS